VENSDSPVAGGEELLPGTSQGRASPIQLGVPEHHGPSAGHDEIVGGRVRRGVLDKSGDAFNIDGQYARAVARLDPDSNNKSTWRRFPKKRMEKPRAVDAPLEHSLIDTFQGRERELCISRVVFRFLQRYVPTPCSLLREIRQWKEDKYLRLIPANSQGVKDGIERFHLDVMSFSVGEIYAMLTDPLACPVFGAQNGDVSLYYASVPESTDVLNRFLLFQFDNDENKVKQFLDDVLCLLDKRHPKRNCMLISGPPHSGKTYVERVIKACMITHGVQKNLDRYSQFPFQNCVHRRLIVWDEPSCERSKLEDLKLLLGGVEMSVAIKHQQDAVLTRTPVLITTNSNEFLPDHEVFNSRIWRYKWKSASMLKDAPHHLHPMCLFKLMNMYNLSFTVTDQDAGAEE